MMSEIFISLDVLSDVLANFVVSVCLSHTRNSSEILEILQLQKALTQLLILFGAIFALQSLPTMTKYQAISLNSQCIFNSL